VKRRSRFQLVATSCRRCGKSIYTGSRPLYGTREMQEKYGRICDKCFTAAEYEAMDQDFRKALPGAIAAGAFR
jgi:hypothetical protein